MLETIQVKQKQSSNGKNGNGTRGERLSLFPDIVAVPTTIIKRDGREAPFDIRRIENAL